MNSTKILKQKYPNNPRYPIGVGTALLTQWKTVPQWNSMQINKSVIRKVSTHAEELLYFYHEVTEQTAACQLNNTVSTCLQFDRKIKVHEYSEEALSCHRDMIISSEIINISSNIIEQNVKLASIQQAGNQIRSTRNNKSCYQKSAKNKSPKTYLFHILF